jgi:ubiquitin carboxyl-terminal hydrolase 7
MLASNMRSITVSHLRPTKIWCSILLSAAACVQITSSSAYSTSVTVSTGLRNLGNTCYLNSQLQCAFHIPKVRNVILTPRDPENAALVSLQHVFRAMQDAALEPTMKVADTRVLCYNLGINVYEQQDSQEFWKLLLPALQLPPLTDLYQGATLEYLRALDGSKRERVQQVPFLDLSLDVVDDVEVNENKKHTTALERALHRFIQPELLSPQEGNGWRPAKGEEPIEAHKGTALAAQAMPPILQIHLKRFLYNWETDRTTKVQDSFSFPLELNMDDFCSRELQDFDEYCPSLEYELQAIVVHMGEFGMGHYYAYVKTDISDDNSWHRFNDDEVTPVSIEEVLTDSFGGFHESTDSPSTHDGGNRGFLSRIRRAWSGGRPRSVSSGFGGATSNAYVLQYVRGASIPSLYQECVEPSSFL